MASMTAVESLCRGASGTVAASTAVVESAVAADTVCKTVGMVQADIVYGIVARPGYPGSIRQKP